MKMDAKRKFYCMCNMAGKLCIPVLVVTLLIALSSYVIYVLIQLSHICTGTNWNVAYMWPLRGMFDFGTHMALAW